MNWNIKKPPCLMHGKEEIVSNVEYEYSEDGTTVYGRLMDGTVFMIDSDALNKIKNIKFYLGAKQKGCGQKYIIDSRGRYLHDYIFPHKNCYEIDHINLNTYDNRKANIRYCTHQQNQINQPLQKNNTSGVSGVSWYPPRGKFRARIKVSQQDIHLGYYKTLEEAVQARNVGMEYMFGEYGRYNDVPSAPEWIRKSVEQKCKSFAKLSVCKAFYIRGR